MRAPVILRSTAFRVALLYAVVFGASVLVLLAFLYWSTAGYMARQADATIAAEIEGLAEQYRREGLERLTRVIAERIRRDPQGRSVYLFADANLNALAGNLDRWPDAIPDADGWIEFPLDTENTRGYARARRFVLERRLRLLVGRDVQELHDVESLIVAALSWGLALTLALAIAGGMATSRAILRRLDTINATSREIMAGDLGRRVPVSSRGDDFDELASNLNRMLDEIESLLASIKQVSDNVAHDLRTPLTRLRQRLEAVQLAAHEGSDNEQLAAAAIEDTDQLLAAFSALLRIARLESGRVDAPMVPVDLSALATDAYELYEANAQANHVHLRQRYTTGAWVVADRDLLFQALCNLLDNALKFTPRDGAVSIEVERRQACVAMRIVDNGPGIPDNLRDKVLTRFFRGDASRSTPGHGLGLSLVAAVAKHHDADITLFDNAPGLTVQLEFMAAQSLSGNAPNVEPE
jgi:signal transduction histidine kinase